MKPFFGTDLTHDKHNEHINDEPFITATISHTLRKDAEENAQEFMRSVKKASPTGLHILHTILFAVAAYCGLFGALGLVGLEEDLTMDTALLFLGIAAVCGGFAYLLHRRSVSKLNTAFDSEEMEALTEKMQQNSMGIARELNLPDSTLSADVFYFAYKSKKDGKEEESRWTQRAPYSNFEVQLYTRDGNLCITDMESVFSIPLSCLKKIRKVDKRIVFTNWNKEEPFNKGSFKPYKIREEKAGYSCPCYYILDVEYQGEPYGIYFPCYELDTFRQATGLTG